MTHTGASEELQEVEEELNEKKPDDDVENGEAKTAKHREFYQILVQVCACAFAPQTANEWPCQTVTQWPCHSLNPGIHFDLSGRVGRSVSNRDHRARGVQRSCQCPHLFNQYALQPVVLFRWASACVYVLVQYGVTVGGILGHSFCTGQFGDVSCTFLYIISVALQDLLLLAAA